MSVQMIGQPKTRSLLVIIYMFKGCLCRQTFFHQLNLLVCFTYIQKYIMDNVVDYDL